ncbi:DUF2946 family protein [Leeia aquatica]|uniref:DUF2946 family protein n=1 Tax=Leeia aquatica TaxID=2725557 RepID=A0A847SDG1_9NEIS|nr:DUF2946 family protein [Leeia aquatica]NLR75486.1 DUF2946 family protein [Leeia aquatica]
MDDQVKRALQRWPGVPAVYGWLRLDARGDWWLDNTRVRHPGLRDFIGRNYAAAADGCHYFQNGPQRVYIELDAAPYVLHLTTAGELHDHTGLRWGQHPLQGWRDEAGQVWLLEQGRLAILDDRSLAQLDILDTEPPQLTLAGQHVLLPLVASRELLQQFNVNPLPTP